MRGWMAVTCVALAIGGFVAAQTPDPVPAAPAASGAPAARPMELQHPVDVPARQLTLRIGLDRAAAGPDGRVQILIDVKPQPRMHVYAPGESDYLPIAFTLADSFTGTADPAVYPAATPTFLSAVNQAVRVYNAPFRISQMITLAAAPPGTPAAAPAIVEGTLKYQACDDSVCYRPESVRLTWQVPRGSEK
jgi:hypothetical protein